MSGKLRTKQPLHYELTQHESGWWLPAQVGGSFVKWQENAQRFVEAVLPHVAGRALVLQAGCHVGLWPAALSGHFARVATFEGDDVNWQAASRNLAATANVTLTKAALGATCGEVEWYRSLSNTGKHKPAQTPRVRGMAPTKGILAGPVPMVTVDSLELPACDLIMLDVEGYEQPVLEGAAQTIGRFRPVVMFEALDHAAFHGYPIGGVQEWLRKRGYREVGAIDDDRIWAPQ